MKSAFFVLLIFLPGILFAQIVDTTEVKKEIDSLLLVSRTLTGKREYEKALAINAVIEKIVLEKLGRETEYYGKYSVRQAKIFESKGDNLEAEKWYQTTLELREKVLGKNTVDYAWSLNNLGCLYKDKGYYEKAEPMLLESTNIFESLLGKEHLDYISSLNNLADLYRKKGDLEKSENLFLESKNGIEKTLGKFNGYYTTIINNLGILYEEMGYYEKAESIYIEAKEIRASTVGKQSNDYAVSLQNLAVFYFGMGYYEKAEQLFLEAKLIKGKVLGVEHPGYASVLNGLAILYKSIGNYEKAEVFYLEVKRIREKSFGKEDTRYAKVLANLANVYRITGKFEEAEPLYEETRIVMEKALGKDHTEYGTCLSGLGNLYYSKGIYKKAESFFLEALSIQSKAVGKEHPSYTNIINNLSILYRDLGEFEKAKALGLEEIAIKERIYGKEHPDYSNSLGNMALLLWLMGDLEKSEVCFTELSILNQASINRTFQYLSEQESSLYVNQFNQEKDMLYSFLQKSTKNKSKFTQVCYNNTLFFKSLLLSASNQIKQLALSDAAATEKLNLLKFCHRRLAAEYAKTIADRDVTHIAEWEEKANVLEKELVHTISGYGDLIRQVTWQEVQQKLSAKSAAVEIISYHYYTPKATDSVLYAALILLPSDTAPHFIPLFEERQLQALLNRPGLSEKLVLKDLYGNNPELRRLIWDPIEPLLREVKTIYYSPSGLLHRLNPGALLDASNQVLSEGRQWVRVGSTRELVTGRMADRSFARAPEGNADNPLTAMVYGGITYDMDSLAFAAANPTIAIDSSENPQRKDGAFSYIITEQPEARTSGTRGNPDGSWGALTATGQEADQVSSMLANAGFRTFKEKGFSASEERFKEIGVGEPSPRILHIATHGFSYPDPKKNPPKGFTDNEPTYKMLDDPMLRSGLVLAGANYYWKNKRPLTNREDGVLVAYEVRDLNLRNTELAVLSACQTGLGDVVSSEGVYGLQRAFRIAGAKFLIVSLWQVPDEQTHELMRIFYQNWLEKKESLRDAFNHAQQALREKEPNPFMWAGFVLIE